MSPFRRDNARSEGAVRHGGAPNVEAVLRNNLGLEATLARCRDSVCVPGPLASSDTPPNAIQDACREPGARP
eukprot:7033190-Lingulodinium_polyedra.AAC.1